jgi:cellulose synthase/poly-beta-1,6-N-acetylglucosamine synthase-like glycosyltransferase
MAALHSLISDGRAALFWLFVVTQLLYLASMLLVAFFYTRPVDLVKPEDLPPDPASYPPVILFYPVLRELEETMRTTFYAIDKIDYPRSRYRIVAIPNHDDYDTVAALERLQLTFPWLEILSVPPTSDPSWNIVWARWEDNPKAYWWHIGKRAGVWNLPPKKTRQLIYAFYNLCPADAEDTLISYIDADSAPPPNYFLLGAAGASTYDVVQLTNVAGNLLTSWATSFHAFDHMCWDVSMYPHMTSHGKHPYYVLGKGLFFRSSDLHAFGGFHPWLTIEDPEVGMRLWTNGRRLGVVAQPLVEEVPRTFRLGVIQRKRWVCGFFQSLGSPIKHMGMTLPQRFRARLNLIPCLSLLVNPVGIAVGVSVLGLSAAGDRLIGRPLVAIAAINITGLFAILTYNWINAWKVSRLVLDHYRDRFRFGLRVNPLSVLAYWIFWSVSIVIGIQMFIRDKGLVWERTEKVDANHDLVRAGDVISDVTVRVRVLERHSATGHSPELTRAGRVSHERWAAHTFMSQGHDLPMAHAHGGPKNGDTRPRAAGGRHRRPPDLAITEPLPVLARSEGPTIPRGRHHLNQDSINSRPVPETIQHGLQPSRSPMNGSAYHHQVKRYADSQEISQRAGLEALYAIARSQPSDGMAN